MDSTALATTHDNEALSAYAPPPGYIHPTKDGQKTTRFSSHLWANMLADYATGLSLIDLCHKYQISLATFWVWSTMPDLAQAYQTAQKLNARALMAQAEQAAQTLIRGTRIDPNGSEPRALDKHAAAALDRGGRLALEVAARLNPEEFSERLQIDKKQTSVTYVVGLSPDLSIGSDAAHGVTVDVPMPDRAGIERANLPQAWRKDLSRERKRKRESSNQGK